MLTEKIRQYNFKDLVIIVIFKIVYKAYLHLFKLFVPQKWSIKYNKRSCTSADRLYNSFLCKCDSDRDRIINEADLILTNRVELFGSYYECDPISGWLNDPVTKGEWPNDVYFASTKVRKEGLSDVKYVLELNKFNHLVSVALAYHNTKDDKYIEFLIKSIHGWRKTILPYKSVCQRIIMDMGFRIINLIQVIILCGNNDKFKMQCEPLINGILYDQVKAIRRFHTARWFKTGNGNNHVVGEMIGALVGTMWLEYRGIKIRRRYSLYMNYLTKVLNKTIAPSGAYLEQSDNYARVVYEFLLFFDIICEIIPTPKLDLSVYRNRSYSKRIGQYLTNICYHDNMPNNGDNDDARVLIAWRPQNKNVQHLLDTKEQSMISHLDGSCWYYRSNDVSDVYIYTRVGKFAYFKEATRIHSHNDLLSLVMGIKGRMIFVDKGCYLYNSGADIIINDRAYASHNTASLNEMEIDIIKNNGAYLSYPKSECVLSEIGHDHCCFEGRLCYSGIQQTRRIEYNKNTIIIIDSFAGNGVTNKGGKIQYILHKDLNAEIINDCIIVTNETNINLTICMNGVSKIQLERVHYSPAFARTESSIAIVGYFNAIEHIEYKTQISIR